MKQEIKKLARRGTAKVKRDDQTVHHAGFVLPPHSLRFCGDEFKDDAYFLKSARLEVKRLVRHAGLNEGSRLLDVGCGPGRLAIGVLAELGTIRRYVGVDVYAPAIAWCQRHLQPKNPSFTFVHFDVANERYNPKGEAIGEKVRLPVEDGAADVINLYSVFSHMSYGDIVNYLGELRRVLAPEGRVFLTAFVEDRVPNYSINPPGYVQDWSGALHCVRFQREFFEETLSEAGFRVEDFEYGRETNGQSAYYLAPNG